MQVKNLQELMTKLKEKQMEVENTTMGKFLGPYSERAAELLGPIFWKGRCL